MTNKEEITTYSIEKAIDLAKENCKAKFDSTIEIHINMGINPKKPEQAVRYAVTLPNGTGKTKKVAVMASKTIKSADLQLSEDDLAKVEKGDIKPKVDFDILVAEPRFMPKLARLGKVLGPAGLMPNPKSGTVTEDVEKAVEQIKKGKIEVRSEPNAPLIHTILGKKSFTTKALVENYEELINSLRSHRPQKVKPEMYIMSVFVKGTMGPAFQVQI